MGNLSFNAGNALLSGAIVGTLSNSTGTLSITFNSNATQVVVNEVLSSIGYANSSDRQYGTVQVDWTFSDGNAGASQGAGGVLAATGSSWVDIMSVNDAPTGAVTIHGTGAVGHKLVAFSAVADADGFDGSQVLYQWRANGVLVHELYEASYTVAPADLGKTIDVQISYVDDSGTEEIVSSAGILIANTKPQFISTAPNPGMPGTALIPVGSSSDIGYSVTLQSDGKIVVAGTSDNGNNRDFSLIRLNANGSLDTSFNGTGKAIIPVGSDGWDNSVTLQSDGKIVVAGSSRNIEGDLDFSLIRLNANGSLDTTFNSGANSLGGSVAYTKGGGAVSLDTSVTVLDAELAALNFGEGNYAGASVTLARRGGADANDLFSALGNLSFNAGNALLSGVAIGTLTNNAGTLAITFNSSATQAVVNEVLSSIGYANSSNTPPARVQVDWAFSDGYAGGALTANGSSTVMIAGGNITNAVAENSLAVTTVTASDALLGSAPKFTLSGTDASLFKISTKGVLTFATVKDYEQPVDANRDNVYEVSVNMTNTKTGYRVVNDLTVGVEFAPINGTAANDTLKGTAGWDTLDGQGGDDKLTGGTGLDTFLVSSGRDTILDFNALIKGATGSEILQVFAGAVANATLAAAWTATSDSFNLGDALITTSGRAVDLSGVTSGAGWDVLNKGRATTLTGSRYDDVLTGGYGNDTVLGGAGSDVLAGSRGSDTLTGGAGADTFRLGGDTKTDHITDFLSGTDRIELDNWVFKALLAEGQLSASQFGQGTAATTAAQRIVYDQPTGNL